MDSFKNYLKIFFYGLGLILVSIILVHLSGAIDPYSQKYRAKSFVLGTAVFFFGMTFFILRISPSKIENASLKEFYKETFASLSTAGKIFQYAYAALGVALASYIIIAEQWHLARGFAKLSLLLSCVLITVSAVIRIILSFVSVPVDTGSSEKTEREPVALLAFILAASLLTGIATAQSLIQNDYHLFSYEYSFVRSIESKKISKIFTQEFLEKEVNFTIVSSDNNSTYYYVAYLEPEEDSPFVNSTVRHILERSLAEDVRFYLDDGNEAHLLKSEEIEKILKDKEPAAESETEAFFTNDLDDKEKLSNIAQSIYEADINIVMSHKDSLYDNELLTIWDIPSYCELAGIDLNSEDWYEKITENKDYVLSTKDFYESICFDSETNSTYGFMLNFGTENSIIVPGINVSSVIEEHSQKPEEGKSL